MLAGPWPPLVSAPLAWPPEDAGPPAEAARRQQSFSFAFGFLPLVLPGAATSGRSCQKEVQGDMEQLGKTGHFPGTVPGRRGTCSTWLLGKHMQRWTYAARRVSAGAVAIRFAAPEQHHLSHRLPTAPRAPPRPRWGCPKAPSRAVLPSAAPPGLSHPAVVKSDWK